MIKDASSPCAAGHNRRLDILPVMVLLMVTVTACAKKPDTTPPDPITGLSAVAGNGIITLSWDESTANDLSHYIVQRGAGETTLADLSDELMETSYVDTTPDPGTTYAYAVRAVDDAGNRSEPSGVATITATSQAWETEQGWTRFAAEEYEGAVTRFSAALAFSSDYAPAHLGMGWSRAFQGELAQARNSLNSANTHGLTGQDANAGLAVVLRDLPDLTGCVARGEMVLAAEPAWAFTRRPSIDWFSIRLILAQAYFRLGAASFPNAQAHLDVLDPGNGLDSADSATWVVESVTYDTYAEALLKAIERISETGGS